MLAIDEKVDCIPSNKMQHLKRTHTAAIEMMTREVLTRDVTIVWIEGKEYWADVQTGTLYDTETLRAKARRLPRILEKPEPKQNSKKCSEKGRTFDDVCPV